MLPVTSEVIRSELEATKEILEKWLEKVNDGIPGMDVPAEDLSIEIWVRQFCGELNLIAGRCETLAGVLLGER
jgi:vacuolar-type H+-ATPase subunit E/Vma4